MILRDMLCGNLSKNLTRLSSHRVLFTGLGFAMFLDQKIIKALEACHSFFKTGPQLIPDRSLGFHPFVRHSFGLELGLRQGVGRDDFDAGADLNFRAQGIVDLLGQG